MPWLTPDIATLSEEKDCRVLEVSGNLWYLVSGALEYLAEINNWESFGTASEDETSQYFREVLDDYITSNMKLFQVGMMISTLEVTANSGWLMMDGSSYFAGDYPELNAILPAGWQQGSMFTLPDMAASVPVGSGTKNGRSFVLGETGGEESHVLTVAEMPEHDHDYLINTANLLTAPGVPVPAGNQPSLLQTSTAGQDSPHENMPPYVVLNWMIYAGR